MPSSPCRANCIKYGRSARLPRHVEWFASIEHFQHGGVNLQFGGLSHERDSDIHAPWALSLQDHALDAGQTPGDHTASSPFLKPWKQVDGLSAIQDALDLLEIVSQLVLIRNIENIGQTIGLKRPTAVVVTLGSDGKPFMADPAAPDDLTEEASAYLAVVRESRRKSGGKAAELDPAVRDALEALGYLQE